MFEVLTLSFEFELRHIPNLSQWEIITLHCFGSCTSYTSQSESTSGCVFCHTTVCTAQHQRIWLTACSSHQRLLLIAICTVNSPMMLVPSTHRSTLGDRTFPMAAARVWNSLPPQTRSASSLLKTRCGRPSLIFSVCHLANRNLCPCNCWWGCHLNRNF